LQRGLIAQVGVWSKPSQVAKNIRKIADAIGVRLKAGNWLKTA